MCPRRGTPDQIKQFQDYWDTEFAGDLAKRRRAKFVPGEAAAKVVQTKEPSHKDDFDEWLARIICYAFSVPPQWAVKLMNRATADNQSAQAQDEGLEPTKEWVKDLIDEIIADEFASPDLELAWLDEDEADPKGMEAVLEGRVKLGAVTLNEMRGALGLDPYANAAADRPMVLTATGYVPIEANAEPNGNSAAPAVKPATDTQLSAPAVKAYNPDQPRVAAGSPGGGQWTSGSVGAGSGDAAPESQAKPQLAEPVSDSRVLSDATPNNTWVPGAQYAGGDEDSEGGSESRAGRLWLELTPGQEVRLQVAEAYWRDAMSQVRVVDPNWTPSQSVYSTAEGYISTLESETVEAQDRIRELATLGIGPGPFAGESIPARGPQRDFTNEERDGINQIGAETGCHTCGTTEPGTSSGNFVPDHQLPSALNPSGQAQRLYPQCISCSWLQGGWVRFLNRARKP